MLRLHAQNAMYVHRYVTITGNQVRFKVRPGNGKIDCESRCV